MTGPPPDHAQDPPPDHAPSQPADRAPDRAAAHPPDHAPGQAAGAGAAPREVTIQWRRSRHSMRLLTLALAALLLAVLARRPELAGVAVHIAESGAPAAPLLRRQGAVLVAGLCLAALGAGAAALPGGSSGAGAAALHVLAAVAVIAAAIAVLPA